MKVSELAKLMDSHCCFNVIQEEKFLDGDMPGDFLDCELEVITISVSAEGTLIVEAKS